MTPQITENPIVCYLLLRTDLPSLGRGKAYAHAMHAGNQLTHELCVVPLMENEKIDARVQEWHDQGEGFGMTLAVGGNETVNLEVMETLTDAAKKCGYLAGIVLDKSYPYQVDSEMLPLIEAKWHTLPPRQNRSGWTCFRAEHTAAWVLGPKKDLEVLMARFGLTPND